MRFHPRPVRRATQLAALVSLAVVGALATLTVATRAARAGDRTGECLDCHADRVHPELYERSAHKDLTCTACHLAEPTTPAPSADGQTCVASFTRTDCARCHQQEAADHAGSVHDGARLPVRCESCHADIHAIGPHRGDKLRTAEVCVGCHERQRPYFQSVHYTALRDGKTDAPTCTDCHGLHAIAKVDNDAAGREFHTRACLQCHDDQEMMARNQVTPIAARTYFQSFHGKNVRLGSPEKVAGCADCHTAHAVRPADDPASSVNRANLVATCGQCHPGANQRFVGYVAHADDHDRDRYPTLYWTRILMTGLLLATFLFFWVHSILWAVRAYVERQRHGHTRAAPRPAEAGKLYRRFTPIQIGLHVVVVVSFLTLAVTGLPLKFHDARWARALASALGGPDRARTIHHAAALVTFGYFAVALTMSVRFLRGKGSGGRGVLARLFGPESLFPNLRDWRDLKAMFRWFTFRGPKPTFERWTYWEKFDFLAVFWGMFAIGASGLMLWFPEVFARVLPGWMFNVATIVHSDEALLATGFIFTVHFFNTHLRPEKFPMDTVIFDGHVTGEEMLAERGDQWRRYQAEGRLDELVVTRPRSLGWGLVLRVFGLAAVAVGVSLTIGMLYALLTGG